MTQTEQQEGNRVIQVYENIPTEKESLKFAGGYETVPFIMSYHKDFNLLIPVAKRVKEELEEILDTEHPSLFYLVELNCAGESFDISQLFPAVVRAVEFLNSIKKEKG